MTKNQLLRMDNVGIVVEAFDEATSFFTELDLKHEGRATIEGEWAGRVTGLGYLRVCSPWTMLTNYLPGFASAARNSSAKWFGTSTRIAFATSADPKAFSSGQQNNSAINEK